MKDSRGPETSPLEPWRRPQPEPRDRAPALPVEFLEQQPPSSAEHRGPRTRRTWLGTVGLVAVGMAGAVGLMRLAYHLTTTRSESDGTIARFAVVSLWIHPALADLAQSPTDSAACATLRGFRRYAEERGLEKVWYVLSIKAIQTNGESVAFSTIRRPYEMTQPYFAEFPTVLALAAGKPRSAGLTDDSKAEVYIIPDRFLQADPRAVLDELRMLEHVSDDETTP